MAENPKIPAPIQSAALPPPQPLTSRLAVLLRDWEKSKMTLALKGHIPESAVVELCGTQLFEIVTAYMREAKAYNAQISLAKAARAKREAADLAILAVGRN